jgi:heme/copper-type cytochrome/quinol oxidase subunit 2
MVFVVAWTVTIGMPWWMCLALILAVVKGVVTTYEVNYVRANGDKDGVPPWLTRVGQLLTWVVLLISAPTLLRPLLRLIFTGDARP